MQPDALIAHYHEIGLKGGNRRFFESALTRNLKRALRGTGYRRVRSGFGRVTVDLGTDVRSDHAAERSSRVFGVAYVGVGHRVDPDMDAITGLAVELMRRDPFESFAVRARRTYSQFEGSSQTINEHVGRAIVEATGGRVKLRDPDATLWIELFGNACVVYRRRLQGPGGLPVGVSGKMICLLSGGIDSPIAAWRMMRRGAEVELLHFHGQPFTDPSSIRQATELAEVLTRYQLRTVLHLVPLGDAQREIVTHAPADMRVVLYRRMMMRIAASLAAERQARALVTGDALGQVASQTIENIHTTSMALSEGDIEILRPLIGMDKQEIMDEARRIGTYDISTRRHQDCCVLFAPRRPSTRVSPDDAAEAEEPLDMEAMVGKALAGIQTQILELPDPA